MFACVRACAYFFFSWCVNYLILQSSIKLQHWCKVYQDVVRCGFRGIHIVQALRYWFSLLLTFLTLNLWVYTHAFVYDVPLCHCSCASMPTHHGYGYSGMVFGIEMQGEGFIHINCYQLSGISNFWFVLFKLDWNRVIHAGSFSQEHEKRDKIKRHLRTTVTHHILYT